MRKFLGCLCVCASVFAADSVVTSIQGETLGSNYNPSYNAPGAIAISHNNWFMDDSFFADTSFTYWYLFEEGLKVATNGVLNTSTIWGKCYAIGGDNGIRLQNGGGRSVSDDLV